MHELWKQYISVLLCLRTSDLENGLDFNDAAVQASLCGKLVKADFSGSRIKVVKSKNSQLLGVGGLVMSESARAFVVINEDESTKILLKEGSVFQFELPANLHCKNSSSPVVVHIWGDNILYKGSERTKIKFKEKYNLELY